MIRTTKLFAALGVILGVAACDNDQLNRPFGNVPIDPLFERYVALGNSITAGFQSAGINDSTQLQSYAVLLARAMRTPFFSPLLNRPGCPPPFVNVFIQSRVNNRPASWCGDTLTGAPRRVPNPGAPFINNVAVPGAAVLDVYSNSDPASDPNGLTTLLLGGLTQTQAMRRVDPTFITLWIGNNDVLGAATFAANAGDSTRITDTTVFRQRYDALLDTLDDTRASGRGVLIGVANVTAIPFFSKGDTYFLIKAGTTNFPANFLVSPNCAPDTLGGQGTNTLVPFAHGFGLIGLAQQNPGNTYTLDCVAPEVIVPAERTLLIAAVTAYNAVISARATARGYAYIDPNALFAALPPGAIPPFPNTTGADALNRPFGDYFSKDGIHPSALAHRIVANTLASTINAEYGTTLPPIP